MDILILYHSADFDGILSREVCRHWLEQNKDNKVTYQGWDYGHPIPDLNYDDFNHIYMVDISIDELMPKITDKLVWIDHHKSAIEKWNDSHFAGYRIDGVAACRLCWQYFHNVRLLEPVKEDYVNRTVIEPTLIRLAGEYDIFDLRDENALPLQFGLRSLSEEEFKRLVDEAFQPQIIDNTTYEGHLASCLERGRAIKTYCDRQNAEYATSHAHTIKWHDLTWCAMNLGQRGNSLLFAGGIKPEHQALFAWRYDGKQVAVSLYHAPGHEQHDLSKIAGRLGGGGHRGACGFRCSLDELATILNNEQIVNEISQAIQQMK